MKSTINISIDGNNFLMVDNYKKISRGFGRKVMAGRAVVKDLDAVTNKKNNRGIKAGDTLIFVHPTKPFTINGVKYVGLRAKNLIAIIYEKKDK